MPAIEISSTHRAIDTYYTNLDSLKKGLKLSSEGSTRRAFSALLDETSSVRKWTLAEEVTKRTKNHRIRLDGVLYGKGSLPRGYWEAKDEADDLNAEILKKKAKEYPVSNIIFEDTARAVLIQDNVEVLDIDIRERDALANLLTRFYNYEMEPFAEFDKAVDWFSTVIPEIGRDLTAKIAESHKTNKKFQTEFDEFMELCKSSLNPNISKEAVDEMLIQHLLTERLIRNIFQSDFTQRNVIANKVEDVISALTKPLFDRSEFQQSLDTFYKVIENAAKSLAQDYQAKQQFINTVYEQFFQGYSVKVADTHGIVYTPQEIVDFMCAAVEEVLQDEFGKKLGQEGVAVLDPATGTGNFIINLLNRVNPKYRRDFYRKHLFANEVMLMPYYIASLNIEHEFYDLEGIYEPFEGISFVDTLDLAKKKQLSFDFMTEKNSARVKRQQETDITVIIGNPPYNVGQLNENDNNKNRTYEVIDERVKETYVRASNASSVTKVYDPYVKFFRWATDRLGDSDGIVCYVTNNGFVNGIAFDGMRKHLLEDFHRVYHLDLHGDVRANPKLSGTTHNVFGIQVGVGITIAVRSSKHKDHKLFYYRVPEMWRKEEKLSFLTWNVTEDGIWNALNTVNWDELKPNSKNIWIVSEFGDEFDSNLPLGSKDGKRANRGQAETVFKIFTLGAATNRDAVVYDYARGELSTRVQKFVDDYNSEVDRYKRTDGKIDIDDFVNYEKIKWSRDLKQDLHRGNYVKYDDISIRSSMYRPFSKQFLYFDRILNEEVYVLPRVFPTLETERENRVICVSGKGSLKDFQVLMSDCIPCKDILEKTQCFPYYVYDEDGSNRRENITDWALAQFREYYGTPPQSPHSNGGKDDGEHSNGGKDDGEHSNGGKDDGEHSDGGKDDGEHSDGGKQEPEITKWDIFYYVYGLLHHPAYRERYADNLKRELPRVPFVPKSTPSPSPSPKHWRGEQDASGAEHWRGEQDASGASSDDTEQDRRDDKKTDAIDHVPTDGIVGTSNEMSAAQGKEGKTGFWAFSRAGKKLADIHLGYEDYKRYEGIEWVTTPDMKADYRVEKMRPKGKRKVKLADVLGGTTDAMGQDGRDIVKTDAIDHVPTGGIVGMTSMSSAENNGETTNNEDDSSPEITVYDTLQYNQYLTLTGIPEKAFAYRLGNRSAIDWIVDQYRIKEDKRSGIVSDPNGYSDDEQYIVKLIERVVQVSVDTVEIVEELAKLPFREE